VMTVAMFMLSRLEATTPTYWATIGSFVLGLGLGMTMQVLILAVQNSVDPGEMGVATSGSTLFRQVGGSIGVALFGTVFTNRVHVELAERLPAGALIPKVINPKGIRQLPPELHSAFADAFAAALHPVFLMAAGVSFVAFLTSWLIHDQPLRTHAAADEPLTPTGQEPDPAAA
jgi:MFS family permease